MDYVPSRTLGDLVRAQAPFDTAAIMRAIAVLLAIFRSNETYPLSPALFHDKISDIAQKVPPSRLLGRVTARLQTLNWSGIPASSSHGDLTFENILITPDGDVTFIDCDEPFASSWQLDLGKLFQDAAGFWCCARSTSLPSARRSAWRRLLPNLRLGARDRTGTVEAIRGAASCCARCLIPNPRTWSHSPCAPRRRVLKVEA